MTSRRGTRHLLTVVAIAAMVSTVVPGGAAAGDPAEPPAARLAPGDPMELISVALDGGPADAHAERPAVSGDGRFVVFDSTATNLVTGVDDGTRQVYLRDRVAGTTALLSANADGQPGDRTSRRADISDDGRYVVFESSARNLLAEADPGHPDIFLLDRTTGQLSLVSEYAGQPSQAASYEPAISGDGRYVAWIEFDRWGNRELSVGGNIWRRERATGAMRLVSTTPDGAVFPTNKWDPQISGDGRTVSFQGVLHTADSIHAPYNLYAWREVLPEPDALGAGVRSGPRSLACPADDVAASGFEDVAGTTHAAAIDCLVHFEVTQGLTPTTYGPTLPVRRDQMASFLLRTLALAGVAPPDTEVDFVDIAGNTHAEAIRRLAGAGIVRGVDAQHYAPAQPVTRAQMATFLIRAYEAVSDAPAPTPPASFTDIAGNTHEASILAAAGLGIAQGVTETTFAPANDVRRDQMASFLTRLLALLLADDQPEQPTEPDEPIEVDEVDPLSIEVDPDLAPLGTEVAPLDDGQPRQLAAVADDFGTHTDVVVDELMVVASDAALAGFLDRWDATVLERLDRSWLDPALDPIHLVRLDGAQGDPSVLVGRDQLGGEPVFGRHRVSQEAVAGLLAISAVEADAGLMVSLNVVMHPDDDAVDYRDGPILDAPDGEAMGSFAYDPDPRTWPHFASGTTQDIGVDVAWRLLAERGLTNPPPDERIRIAVFDGGFADLDLPPGAVGADGRPGVFATCGSNPCPWHGTSVTQVAVGQPGNAIGAAGTGGPVGTATMIGVSGSTDAFTSLRLTVGLGDLLGNQRPRIVNMSFSVAVPRLLAIPLEADIEVSFLRLLLLDFLPIASAGNQGEHVNEQRCVDLSGGSLVVEDIACMEVARTWPCQASSVLCVGGMDIDSLSHHPDSNHGVDVELWGPFVNYVGPDPDTPALNEVRRTAGTSGSAPFVSGVAALVMAADPSLSARQVRQVLLTSARPGEDRVSRAIQARTAVRFALEGPFEVVWVSQRPDGQASDGATHGGGQRGHAALTADGREILFTSTAEDLLEVAPQSNVYRSDLDTGVIVAGSEPSLADRSGDDSWDWAMVSTSADGQMSAFATRSRVYGLPPDCVDRPIRASQVFAHDEATGETSWISATVEGAMPTGSSINPDVAADGSVVAFETNARELIAGLDPGGYRQVLLAPLPGRRCTP